MKRYFASIKRYSWVVLACMMIALGVGFVLAKAQPRAYLVTASLVVHAGAPGTTIPGSNGNADSIGEAADYAAEIPTRSVMSYVYNYDPQIQQHHYTVDDLVSDVSVLPASTTTSVLVITCVTPHEADTVLLCTDVAKGFQAYKQFQLQQQLDAQRKNLQDQYNSDKTQSDQLEAKILSYGTSADPHVALYTADRNSLLQTMNSLQAQLLQLPQAVQSDIFITQLPELADVTSSSHTSLILAATGGVGLLLGLVLMALLIFLDNRLCGDDMVKAKLGLAYLGSLSSNANVTKNPTHPSDKAVQELADICANLRLTGVLPGEWSTSHGVALLVTSPQTAEGKTTVAAALAATVARAGSTVVVVDGNLHRPSTHLAFGLSAMGPGLSGLLKGMGTVSLDNTVLRSNVPGVWVLPVGTTMEDPTLLLAQRFPDVLAHLRKKTALVIIDGPAILSGADAAVLATMVDGIALVLDVRHDKLEILLRAKDVLADLTHTPVGVVLNRLSGRKRNRYYASSYPTKSATETWEPVQAYNGNGHNREQAPESHVLVPSISHDATSPFDHAIHAQGTIRREFSEPPVSPTNGYQDAPPKRSNGLFSFR